MVELGFTLSSEEHPPDTLVELARAAEEAGFSFATISDHFHPWTSTQGQSPFVWSVLGGIAAATERLRVGTAVTCPLIRIHPAIIAQASATVASMLPGRFFLGLGTGENLNEHVTGERWPSASERREMLAEAIEVIRRLWAGGPADHEGRFYRVVDAELFTRPDEPPPIYVAAAGPKAAAVAGELGDGLIATSPEADLLRTFDDGGGKGKPRIGLLTVCWAEDEEEARRTALKWWPNAALEGELGQELPLPRHFEQAVKLVTEDAVAGSITCGPDPDRHVEAVGKYAKAGYDMVAIHQVGPDAHGGLRFYAEEVVPRLEGDEGRLAG